MPKNLPKGGIAWNPKIVEMAHCQISKKDEQLMLTSVARLIYDLACQFSEGDQKPSSTSSNFSGQKIEVRE